VRTYPPGFLSLYGVTPTAPAPLGPDLSYKSGTLGALLIIQLNNNHLMNYIGQFQYLNKAEQHT